MTPHLTDDAPFYIVLNPASGGGDADRAREEIASILDGVGRPHEFLTIDRPARIAEVAAQATKAAVRDDGAVIVAGGDGTINAVAQSVLATGRPFGIIPQGTFNYSCRAHGVPLERAEATRSLLDARIKPVQVGLVNGHVFLVNASLGLYPEVLQDREHFKRRYGRKRIVALLAALATILRGYRQLTLAIDCDGVRETVHTPTLFVGNNPLQLERVGLRECEDVQDRRLAGIIVRPVSTPSLLWLAVRGALGGLGEEERVRSFAFSRMTVQPLRRRDARTLKIAADGEISWLPPPLEFSVAPQSLMLMVPR